MKPQVSRDEWERAEVQRSACEAALTGELDPAELIANHSNCGRYLDPPADTVYPLEYACYLLGDVRGKVVVDYGCGNGENTLILASRGALVKAIDISPDLVALARKRIAANGLESRVEFIVGSAYEVPVAPASVDVVFGVAILHHLDLSQSAREVHRILKPGGRAIFQEPVRNSRTLRFVRMLIPYQAPDVSPFERPLTDAELAAYAGGFSQFRSRAFLLPSSGIVERIPALARSWLGRSYRADAWLLHRIPPLRHFATVRVIELVK